MSRPDRRSMLLSVPVPTPEEWETTLARVGNRLIGVKHG